MTVVVVIAVVVVVEAACLVGTPSPSHRINNDRHKSELACLISAILIYFFYYLEQRFLIRGL